MSDFELSEEPGPVVDLVGRVERIMSLQRENTEAIRKLWIAGEVEKLPCHDQCNGEIVLIHRGERIRGFCPTFMEGPCPLPSIQERKVAALLRKAGVQNRYHEVDVDKLRARPVIETWLSNCAENIKNGRGLIFAGEVGVGKTMSLAYMARRLISEDHGVWMVMMPRFIDMLFDRAERKPAVQRAMAIEVLMLDDFGAGEMPAYVVGIMEGIIESRHSRKMPTIVSTNLTRDALKNTPAFRRMVDRWREANQWVTVGGTSQRGES